VPPVRQASQGEGEAACDSVKVSFRPPHATPAPMRL
jgi:hypothetical protein